MGGHLAFLVLDMLKSTAEVLKGGESAWGGVEEEDIKVRLLKLGVGVCERPKWDGQLT